MATSKVTAHPSAGAVAPGRSAELDLVDRCRRGELGAFEELYRAHSGRLFSLEYVSSGFVQRCGGCGLLAHSGLIGGTEFRTQ